MKATKPEKNRCVVCRGKRTVSISETCAEPCEACRGTGVNRARVPDMLMPPE